MPPPGSMVAEAGELHNSLLISIKRGPRIPHPYHLSSDKQSNRPRDLYLWNTQQLT